jgi:serine phosphatase RsbU (regulator of sigma subunit)
VGGDFYYSALLSDGTMMLVLGDVSGKGLPAAMTVSTVMGALRNESTLSPAKAMQNLNRVLYASNSGGFTTCLCARVDPDGSITLASAGHLPPYLNGAEVALPGALPLGVAPEVEYTESLLHLAPGGQLTMISDGVVEARSSVGELFGFEHTRRLSAGSAESLADAAQRFGQQDDITVLTLIHTAAAGA